MPLGAACTIRYYRHNGSDNLPDSYLIFGCHLDCRVGNSVLACPSSQRRKVLLLRKQQILPQKQRGVKRFHTSFFAVYIYPYAALTANISSASRASSALLFCALSNPAHTLSSRPQ